MLLKTIFCKHIWKDDTKIFLGERRMTDGGKIYGCPTYSNFKFYGIEQKCLKCDKIKYVEKRVMII